MDPLPPPVLLPGHYAKAGLLLQWRKRADGSWEALVEFTAVIPGFRGGIEPERRWFLAHEVKPIPGEDYSRVPRTRA